MRLTAGRSRMTIMQATDVMTEMPEVKAPEPKPVEKMSNKFLRPDIERYPVYTALSVGFEALNGKRDTATLTNRLQEFSANA